MALNKIRCGILGGQERDLAVLSTLHNRERVEVVFVYDQNKRAVGIEIAEILGIARCHIPDQLTEFRDLEFVVVSEPREKYSTEIDILTRSGAKILNPSEALQRLTLSGEAAEEVEKTERREPQSIDDTLSALEKLFDRKELLRFLLDVAVEATSSSAGSIMLYSSETDELYIAYAIGLSERVVKRTRQKLGTGIAGGVAQTRQARLVQSSPESMMYADERERMDVATAISVPLMWTTRLLGVLNVSVGKRDRQLDDNDLDTLKRLSRRISRVLFQSIKLEEVQVRHQEWRFRSTMGEIAGKAITTQEKFSVLSRYLSELMGAETVEVFVNTVEGDWFVLGGSNKLLSPRDRRVRCRRGALSRAFLENRCVVLTEGEDSARDPLCAVSSVVYCPVGHHESQGVIVLEFTERYKLDEFLIVKDAIALEISRFLASELRDRRLNRELHALRAISDAAPSILGCRTAQQLADALAATTGVVLESERVSVRIRRSLAGEEYAESFFGVPADRLLDWKPDDDNRFATLARERRPFATAFLSFDPPVREHPAEYRSVLAFPIHNPDGFHGGIIAYDKSPDDPLEDAVYSELDRTILDNLVGLSVPVLDAIYRRIPVPVGGKPTVFEAVLEENLERLRQVCADEISRSERYHHSFTLILFRISVLPTLFERDRERALALVTEMTEGIETRTRKTDFGAWIAPDTYAILTLDGGRRIRFLVSRATMYLAKDLSALADIPAEEKEIHLGAAGYPGTAKDPDGLLEEARRSLKPHTQG